MSLRCASQFSISSTCRASGLRARARHSVLSCVTLLRMNTLKLIAVGALTASATLGSTLAANHDFIRVDAPATRTSSLPAIEKIVAYNDMDYGFQLAVPESWARIFAAEDDLESDVLEPGYAVGFESPRTEEHDMFADYLMVEILPGAHSGAFASDGTQTKVVMVDGRVAVTDKIELDGFDVNGAEIDLIVFQAEIVELGFTVGIFAIGEKSEAAVLADAFALALKTFKVPDDPFSVS